MSKQNDEKIGAPNPMLGLLIAPLAILVALLADFGLDFGLVFDGEGMEPFAAITFAAGYQKTSITEPDTGTAGTGGCHGSGQSGQYTVPTGITSLDLHAYGAGGGRTQGGGGGYAEGTLAVTSSQVLHAAVGRGGAPSPTPGCEAYSGGGKGTNNFSSLFE
mgnify:CR=1 FL=1